MHTEIETAGHATRTPIWLRALNWLADRDAAYRGAHKLRAMPDGRLDDLGITRDEANAAFYHRDPRRVDQGVSWTLLAFRLH